MKATSHRLLTNFTESSLLGNLTKITRDLELKLHGHIRPV